MSVRRIIALDLGKFKTVACVMNARDRSPVFETIHVFETIQMSPSAVHDLLACHASTDPRRRHARRVRVVIRGW